MPGIPDPFLARHQYGEKPVFGLFGHNPQSIRDQMIRGVMIIDRARRLRLIAPDRPPLVIVGAGAAGATAALRAACKYKIKTYLLERKGSAFLRQKDFTSPDDKNLAPPREEIASRFVCPTQYDFPVSHWPKARFPWDKEPQDRTQAETPEGEFPLPDIPLEWDAGTAHSISTRWQTDFDIFAGSTSGRQLLKVRYLSDNFHHGHCDETSLSMAVRWEEKGVLVLMRAGMAILATGYGKERCSCPDDDPSKQTQTAEISPQVKPDKEEVPRFRGPNFWASDQLEEPVYEHRDLTRSKAVIVISGGGDGGLQDMLRVCFAKPAKQIFDLIFPDQDKNQRLKRVRQDIFSAIGAAEDQHHRASFMVGTGADQERLLEGLHQKHLAMINQIVDDSDLFEDVCDTLTMNLVTPPPKALYFVHGQEYFSQSYGLNRFLIALLLHPKFRPDWVHPLYGKRVKTVTGAEGHVCKNDAEDCFARPHQVFLIDAPGFTPKARPGTPASSEKTEALPAGPLSADIVILRHGYFNEKGDPIEMIQDVMPYALPGF